MLATDKNVSIPLRTGLSIVPAKIPRRRRTAEEARYEILAAAQRRLAEGGPEAIRLQDVRSNGYSYQIETTYRGALQGMRIKEVPIQFVDRTMGRSKMSRKIFLEAVLMVWKLRADALRHKL